MCKQHEHEFKTIETSLNQCNMFGEHTIGFLSTNSAQEFNVVLNTCYNGFKKFQLFWNCLKFVGRTLLAPLMETSRAGCLARPLRF